jgi:putative hydrolase of the HAD superfamily
MHSWPASGPSSPAGPPVTSHTAGPGSLRGVPETHDAFLIDLYSTFVWSNWTKWQETLAARLGLGADEVERAFDATRPARSVGTYPHPDDDIASVLEALGLEPTTDLVRDVRELEEREILQDIHLYEDSIPVVRELRARGKKTALVSNCSNNTRPVVDRLGLDQEFDAVILSFEVGARKPLPEIYRIAMERLGVQDPSSALFVDDQPEYCDGAAAVGLDTRLIVRPDQDPPTDTHGHRVIVNLSDLLAP